MIQQPMRSRYSQKMGREYEGANPEYILNGEVRILRATGTPCPVCGEPNGNCAGELEPPKHLVGSTTFPSLGYDDTYVVPEDVWRDVHISDKTKTKVLVARKGAVLPLKKAQELGLC